MIQTSAVIRFFDVVLSVAGLVFGTPIMVFTALIVYFETGSPIFRQERVGRCKRPFKIIKFRTMALGTQSISTHLVGQCSLTVSGKYLRRLKLDELPQLWNVLVGEMSLVGPRPNLLNQDDVIRERDARSIYSVRPGITGLSQLRGVDMSNPRLLAECDHKMILEQSANKYFLYILMTLFGGGGGDRVR